MPLAVIGERLRFPLEEELRRERARFMATIESLSDEEFDHAPTLCEGWAPRDVLAHVIGVDQALAYARNLGRIHTTNAEMVRAARRLPRDRIVTRAWLWAERPSLTSRLAATFILGDLAVHHQDVLRPLGRTRQVPPPVATAILREGMVWGGRKLRHYRVVPTDGGRPRGRGREVRGSAEALGMWLAGRHGIEPDLDFAPG